MTDKLITHDEAYTRLVFGDKVVWHEKQFLEDYIRQNEQRDKDVARYFELASEKYVEDMQVGKISLVEYRCLTLEEEELKQKLSKVGKEE
jgi:hypothetical protein